MNADVAVLVSVGRHPASGRWRRADLDARAVELALRLAGDARIALVHAGDGDEAALRDYLGMGVSRMVRIATPPGADPLPALADWLARAAPRLILTGAAAETGEGSGMTPYWLARRLGLRLVPGIAELELSHDEASLVQAVAGGRRRRLVSPFPLLATVAERAPAPRLPTFLRARRGGIAVVPANAAPPDDIADWTIRPARARPARAMASAAGSARDRLRALRGEANPRPADGGQPEDRTLIGPSPDEAADRILRYLKEEGLLSG